MSAFFIYQNIPSIKKIDCNDKICVKLCDVITKKQVVKPTSKPKPKVTKAIKPKPKPKLETTFRQKVIKKEVIKEPEFVEEKEETSEVMEVVIAKNVVKEDTMTKQKRIEKEYMQEHIAKIVQLLQENLYYPRRARKRGIVGEVVIRFTLATNATVHSIKVILSNSDILSRAAIKTIENLSGEFPKPPEELTLHIPINYELKR